ncbi:hypothetical protein TanjilG_21713 [Lupinus angustifolius]|uniref:C2H2-type domain-containing protein n=1 Tax=Lupinus angustifolius TaxID=3871 RepID=A0A1J7FNF6_LUPAN|nr:PREDICTED: zinc finger protein ZAT9-like [Lupinus angustifolius]OIV89446.1 hypothetical protein TanjilG_21713 [Lupinus angustifolius]
MEKHKCKLCLRRFSNGRALGGHMRSHMMNFPLPRKAHDSPSPNVQLSFEAESTSSSSSEEEADNNINYKHNVCYGLREKPKRSVRLEDPEFSSVILQDSESETESSKNTTRYTRLMSEPCNYRSRRTRKFTAFDNWNNGKQVHEREAMMKRMKLSKDSKAESWVIDHEPLCSSSDVTTEEDVAFCLMMLSRDQEWKRQKYQDQEQEQSINDQYYEEEYGDEDEDEVERSIEEDSDDESEEEHIYSKNRVRGRRYKCETCNKVFRSYQALGGHRASHKKIKVKISTKINDELELENNNGGTSSPQIVVEKKIHECPVCFRVFASGQALGGHKRTHVIGLAPTTTTEKQVSSSTKHGNNFIDLNLPAPVDDDEICQIKSSAVLDAEFLKTH